MNNNRDTLHSKSQEDWLSRVPNCVNSTRAPIGIINISEREEFPQSHAVCMGLLGGVSFIPNGSRGGTQTKANVVLKQGKNNNSQMGFSTHNCPLRKSELGGNIGSQKPLRLFSAPALKLSLLICASLCITCDKSDYSGAWTRGEQCEWVIAPYTPYCAPSNAQRGASLDSHTAYLGPKASDGGPSGVSSSVGGRHSTKQRGSKWGRLVARAIFS